MWRIIVHIGKVLLVVAAAGDRNSVGPHEAPIVIEILLDPESTFVHQRVMLRA